MSIVEPAFKSSYKQKLTVQFCVVVRFKPSFIFKKLDKATLISKILESSIYK